MKNFDIGDFVMVHKTQHRDMKKNIVSWLPKMTKEVQLGRVVGKCRRYSGTIKGGVYVGGTLALEPEYGSNYLDISKAHIFYLIRFGWFNKPVLVLEEDLRIAELDEIKDLPQLFIQQIPWTEQDKQNLREEMQNVPRDLKGRWI